MRATKFPALLLTASFILCTFSVVFSGTTGKIAGTVTDVRTGDAIPGANVIIEGTTIGTTTDVDGYYVLLNVTPGVYTLRVTMVGYAAAVIRNVRVEIDQTTQINVKMSEAVIGTDEVVITAERPVVQRDVSASRANITAREMEAIPTISVSTIVGQQAGVSGLGVRGGDENQTSFILNGIRLRDGRSNDPYSGISLLSIQEIQIQTGGFNAEYGEVRSGVVNVITKEGNPQKYNVGVVYRYSPPTRKYFGISPNDRNAFWIRPFVDDDVCWTGTTSGAWSTYMQKQYPSFAGWNALAQANLKNTDPNDDLTPQQLQRIFLWQHRKDFNITQPDYDVDFGLSGPFPMLSEELGKLRFYAGYRFYKRMYMFRMSRDNYNDWSATLKLTSDIGKGMKLMVEGLVGRNEAVDRNNNGTYRSYGDPSTIGAALASSSPRSYTSGCIFDTDYWCQNAVDRNNIGLKFTHVLSTSTFYEVTVSRFASQYATNPGRMRDTNSIYQFGPNFFIDESPFGAFHGGKPISEKGIADLDMVMGGAGTVDARDSSKVVVYDAKMDFTTQLGSANQVKAGFELIYTDNSVNYARIDYILPEAFAHSKWQTYPTLFSAYVQDKLEFEGMNANIGVRFELSHAGGEWYSYDPYTKYFKGPISYGIDTLLKMEPTKVITSLSPRLGIAFPISEDAKLFFNYGHFRQMPAPEDLFLVRHEGGSKSITVMANPNLPRPKTIQYELGYEHNLGDLFLFRLASYYKDISNETRYVNYIGFNNVPNYTVAMNTMYRDIRGFEATLSKNRGDWIQGWINYTYMVSTYGYFDWTTKNQDPMEQTKYQLTTTDYKQTKPLPRPYARLNVDFFTPEDFGPEFAEIYPIGDLRISFNGSWQSGAYTTYVGGGSKPGVIYNLQYRPTWSNDMRISKNFRLGRFNVQLFADITNVLNLKQYSQYGYTTAGTDYDSYMRSLHFHESPELDYGNIPGDDKPGDYRDYDTPFQPMVYSKGGLPQVTAANTAAWYYNDADKQYWRVVNNAWELVPKNQVDDVLDKKAYIDMPNQPYFVFLNPRNVFFGIRMSFDIY